MTEYFDSIAKRIANILLTLAVSFALFACADIGERDNPVDPGYKGNASSVKYGSLTDSRDGQVYKTVTIGTQTWMAENLNYNTSSSYCYEDNAGNCSKYGRLYEWSAAMSACPTGWHLPSDEEWNILWDAVGGIDTAGSKLKSTSGWYDNGNGTDSFGFAVLPAGSRYDFGDFSYEGYLANFWSSTGSSSSLAYYWAFRYDGDDVRRYNDYEYDGFSVRCLRDSDEGSEASSSSIKDPELVEGTMTDSRDGQTYKTVKIGAQTWMAENLNYDPGDVSGMGSYAWSGCYDNESANCSKYGRLYTWEVAMDKAGCGYGTYCNNSYEGTQGVCPAGWHLPSDAEWRTLFDNVGGTGTAGSVLKSSSGWSSGNGTNSFGFAVLPAGGRYNGGYFLGEGSFACFWSSTEYGSDNAYSWRFTYDDGSVDDGWGDEINVFSVRCLRDSDEGSGASSSSSQAQPSNFSSSSSSWSLEEAIGSMTDSRDGQVYKTVTIGTQTWMAENLNYNTSGSYCYGDNAGNCSKYGRLYEWSAAMDACPTGWLLPSDEEWNTLWDAVGGTNTAGSKLKSSSGWNNDGNGTNSFGFAVLPAGRRYDYGNFYGEGDYAGFWSSTEYDSSNADRWYFRYGNDDVHYGWGSKYYAFSVRCLRD